MRNKLSRSRDNLRALKALASDTRLTVLQWLKNPVANFPPQVDGDPIKDGVCADFIREKLGIAAATASHHLTLLTQAIFLESTSVANTVRARVFDLFEELPFAGHPIIGAAASLHRASGGADAQTWQIELPGKTVRITTARTARGYFGLLDQGAPEFFGVVDGRERFARAFNLKPHDLNPDLPLQRVSTGLRCLTVPV